MADTNIERLRRVLDEVFMLDQADLDFGIYRIMNVKRDEITRFLDNDLLPQVKATLAGVDEGQRAQVKQELDELEASVTKAGMKPGDSPKVQELRAKYKAGTDIEALENEVYSHLASFFRRYYKEGDFLSLRRYKEGVYAIPYEGEEVKLHWANADQYYIKSSEQFRDYAFKLAAGRRVHFKLASADTETDNNKAAAGQERRFILAETDPVSEEGGDLIIRFEYRPDPDGRKREPLNAEAEFRIMDAAPGPWQAALAEKRPTEKNPGRTLLAKHLNDYTARNTFDYFIHKDLGGFLRRELDFYIKNEVMHLDDIENETAPKVDSYLAKIRAIRSIAHKIIDLLAQLEDFQKKLWLKKKFVVETNYCVTLDRVPEELYAEIAANDAQREEWVRLFAIDEIKDDLTQPAYSEPVTIEFLKSQPHLVLDTRHFAGAFTDRLLSAIDDVEGRTGGCVVIADNFHGLRLLSRRMRQQVACAYIDPPYNTDASAIAYKNDYKDASWLSLIENRLLEAAPYLSATAVTCIAIDDTEVARLKSLVDTVLGWTILGTAVVRSNPAGRSTPKGFAEAHDYAVFVAASAASSVGRLPRSEQQLQRYSERDSIGSFEWVNFRKHGGSDARREARPRMFYPILAEGSAVRLPEIEWDVQASSWSLREPPRAGQEIVWPVNGTGDELRWKWGPEAFAEQISDFCARPDRSGKIGIYMKARMNDEGMLPVTWWDDKEYSATEYGTNLLKKLFGRIGDFSFPKAIKLVVHCLRAAGTQHDSLILDYFAGSGTTAHAVINMNREDAGHRKYILMEMGEYFDTVLKPRIQKVIYSKDWKDGKPVSREGSSHMFKYIRLESYEDALNNLELKRTDGQQELLDANAELREDYTLRYMLDVEAKGSASLLNIDAFEDPFSYTLNVASASAGETRPVNVDLVETFSYLIGLRVKTIDRIHDFRIVTGESPDGEKVLVIWRNTKQKSNADLDEFFRKQGYTTKDQEFDIIYVNGDNNLENLRREDETWKVRLIEEDFQRLMFDVQDV